MSLWIDINPDDIDVEREENEVQVYVNSDRFGANYITIPLDVLEKKIKDSNRG